ncbi:MAG: hypothetical protein E2O37_00165 [Proteobacteria bacterium]|nr:MAG: hypothetical protein E2O37_00165 [Pseudomonadota bacterium]TDJ72229.1 MAG: hypothetical protein E2O38_05395 [Pseudomonadota bacterium]
MTAIQRESIIICPVRRYQKTETMPTDACLFYHERKTCNTLLRPKTRDCCVFCSYGTVPCPPIQLSQSGSKPTAGCCPE